MNFRDQLLAELSRRNADYMASAIGTDKKLFKQIIDLVFTNDAIISGRAAWVVEICWLKYPALIEPYIEKIIDFLPKAKYDNQRRHFVKILSTKNLGDIGEHHLGILIDICFTWLEDPIYPTAVKMFSMQVIYNYVKIEPALAGELIAIIENQYEDSPPGFKSRGRKILKGLYQITN